MVWHAPCERIARMTRMSAHRIAQSPSFLRVLGSPATPTEARADLIPPRAIARRKRPASPRTGLLRLAPRLTVLTGSRREPDWRVIAGGIAAAVAEGDDEETPWIA